MEMPEFPKDFVRDHCVEVRQARYEQKKYKLPPDEDDALAHAQCAFVPRGFGLMCETCDKFLCSAPPTSPADDYLPAIRKYYGDMEKYEAYLKKQEEAVKASQGDVGAYI